MANAVAERIKKPTVVTATDEISELLKQISENARLARQSEKELVALRKQNEKSFAEMHKALDRLRS
jgi:hypothetical protein